MSIPSAEQTAALVRELRERASHEGSPLYEMLRSAADALEAYAAAVEQILGLPIYVDKGAPAQMVRADDLKKVLGVVPYGDLALEDVTGIDAALELTGEEEVNKLQIALADAQARIASLEATDSELVKTWKEATHYWQEKAMAASEVVARVENSYNPNPEAPHDEWHKGFESALVVVRAALKGTDTPLADAQARIAELEAQLTEAQRIAYDHAGTIIDLELKRDA